MSFDFEDYFEEAMRSAIYPNRSSNITYPTLGLAGEVGEFAEKVKKVFRDKDGLLSNEDRLLMLKELGDVLWYVSAASYELGSNLREVAEMNIEKLRSRRARNVIKGNGDER